MPSRMKSDDILASRWPKHLVDQISRGQVVLCLGAGASSSAASADGYRPPGWEKLLRDLIPEVFGKSRIKARTAAKTALERHQLLECAQVLKHFALKNGKGADFRNYIVRAVEGPDSKNPVQPGRLHEIVLDLSPQIIVTTNYDQIIERATLNAYKMHSYTSTSVAAEIRQGNEVLLKIHGGVDRPDDMIISRPDFARVRAEGGHALGTLQALLMTRPFLFVGYSLRDPDIQMLLENVAPKAKDSASHYLLTGADVRDDEENFYSEYFGVNCIKFGQGDYAEAERMLQLLVDRVEAASLV